jgi:hypothetical protein
MLSPRIKLSLVTLSSFLAAVLVGGNSWGP